MIAVETENKVASVQSVCSNVTLVDGGGYVFTNALCSVWDKGR